MRHSIWFQSGPGGFLGTLAAGNSSDSQHIPRAEKLPAPAPAHWVGTGSGIILPILKSSGIGMQPQRPSHYPAALQIWAISHASPGCKLIWYSSSSQHTISRRARLLEQGYEEQWGVLGESHQGQGKCQGTFGSAASQRHGLLSPELVTPGLSNASALPSEVQLMLHTIPSLGTHLEQFQTLSVPVAASLCKQERTLIWYYPRQRAGQKRKRREGKKNKVVQFVSHMFQEWNLLS